MADSKRWSRRELLKQSGMISVAGAATALVPGAANALVPGAAKALAPAAAKAATAKAASLKAGQVLAHDQVPFTDGDFNGNIFTRIGVRPLINCRGTITAISGSTSLPEVKQAMYNASLYHVRMDEMMDAVGAELRLHLDRSAGGRKHPGHPDFGGVKNRGIFRTVNRCDRPKRR